jgi:hypothetical protein
LPAYERNPVVPAPLPTSLAIAPGLAAPRVIDEIRRADQPVTFSGVVQEIKAGYGWGTFDTAHFALSGGDYAVSWTATSIGNTNAHNIDFQVRREVGESTVYIVSGTVDGGHTSSGKTVITGDDLGKAGYPAFGLADTTLRSAHSLTQVVRSSGP